MVILSKQNVAFGIFVAFWFNIGGLNPLFYFILPWQISILLDPRTIYETILA